MLEINIDISYFIFNKSIYGVIEFPKRTQLLTVQYSATNNLNESIKFSTDNNIIKFNFTSFKPSEGFYLKVLHDSSNDSLELKPNIKNVNNVREAKGDALTSTKVQIAKLLGFEFLFYFICSTLLTVFLYFLSYLLSKDLTNFEYVICVLLSTVLLAAFDLSGKLRSHIYAKKMKRKKQDLVLELPTKDLKDVSMQ